MLAMVHRKNLPKSVLLISAARNTRSKLAELCLCQRKTFRYTFTGCNTQEVQDKFGQVCSCDMQSVYSLDILCKTT